MIIAGIDEAGYGPLLGPLVVGCCAFEIPDGAAEDPALCLWKRLNRLVSKNRSKTGRKIHVNDSKIVYSPAGGLKELERSVLTLSTAAGRWCETVDAFLSQAAPQASGESQQYVWYRSSAGERFPLAQDPTPIRLMSDALGAEMKRASTYCVHFSAQMVFERRFNQMVEATRNKGAALFSIGATHLDYLLRNFGHRNLVIVCDRHGGRERYGALLRLMFPDWSLEIDHESDGDSRYALLRDGHRVRILYREKAEVGCLSVAAASMLSKYLREAMMRRFNAFWLSHLPGLIPTAGYYNDGTRFLNDIRAKRDELGVTDAQLVRSR